MSQYSGKITFYEGKYFTGRKLEVFGSCDNFQDRGFMNRVNSIRVQSGAWICFDHPDFRGQQYILEHGEYPDFHRWNGHNDHMASCRPVGMHGEHYRMEIFDGSHFSGDCMEFTEDCSFLQGRGWNKNCVNAIKVYGDGATQVRFSLFVAKTGDEDFSRGGVEWSGDYNDNRCQRGNGAARVRNFPGFCTTMVQKIAWVLYEEPNYRGRMYVVERGEYSSFNAWQAHSANIQSIRRVVNYF